MGFRHIYEVITGSINKVESLMEEQVSYHDRVRDGLYRRMSEARKHLPEGWMVAPMSHKDMEGHMYRVMCVKPGLHGYVIPIMKEVHDDLYEMGKLELFLKDRAKLTEEAVSLSDTNVEKPENVLWKKYAADFNGMTDEEIEKEVRAEQEKLEEAESWLEAVASWKEAGKPRTK